MKTRCDGLYDCKDNSDENNCKKVVVNGASYQKELAPFEKGKKVQINVSIFLLNVKEIELPSTFDVKIGLTLSWKDYRLKYQNLQQKRNVIDRKTTKKIWAPC